VLAPTKVKRRFGRSSHRQACFGRFQ
jgi:hypothetical protein